MKALFLALVASVSLFADIHPMLIGGSPADVKDWPASVYASMSGARCTATVIGEKVLLIAAHCVKNGGSAQFSVGANKYSSTCTHAPQYTQASHDKAKEALETGVPFNTEEVAGNATADWALCKVDKAVTGTKFELVNQDPDLHKVGDKLTLTGYGCVKKGGGGGNDGIYRVGQATITDLPSGTDNDIVTRGGAALCFGDSGGPAFYQVDGVRYVASVNSRGDIKVTSYLSSVSTDMAKKFFADWASKNAVKICGVHADAVGCRDGKPGVDKSFEIDHLHGKLKFEAASGHEKHLAEVKKAVQAALDSVKE